MTPRVHEDMGKDTHCNRHLPIWRYHRYAASSLSSPHVAISLIFLLLVTAPSISNCSVFIVPLQHSHGGVNLEELDNSDVVYKSEGDNLRGMPGEGYYIELLLGTPPQSVNVLVDTGSSNFAVATSDDQSVEKFFNVSLSSTFNNIGTSISVPYTQGAFEGYLGQDVVSVPSVNNLTATDVNIACITLAANFFINGSNWQGILGLAYAEIARPDSSVITLVDSIVEQHNISNIFSIQLCGLLEISGIDDLRTGGSMVFGGIDTSLYKGDIVYAPIYKQWYYEIILTEIVVGDHSLDMDCKEYNFDKTIVDSGTTNLRLPKKVFVELVRIIKHKTERLEKPIPEAFWLGGDMLCWPDGTTPLDHFPNIHLRVAQTEYTTFDLVMTPQQYIRQIKNALGIILGETCFKFAISPSETGAVLGAVLMEGFYVIFDRDENRIGFAPTTCKFAHHEVPKITTPKSVKYNTTSCAYIKTDKSQTTLLIIAYVMAGVCAICMVPIILVFVQCQWGHKCRKEEGDGEEEDAHDQSGLLNSDDIPITPTT